jgi:hypothetical protein
MPVKTAFRGYVAHHRCPSQVNAILRYRLSESKLSPSTQHSFPIQLKDTNLAIPDHRCSSIYRPSLRFCNIEELERTEKKLVMSRTGSVEEMNLISRDGERRFSSPMRESVSAISYIVA